MTVSAPKKPFYDFFQSNCRLKITLFAVLLVTLAFLAYFPAMQGGYIWDDEHYITGNSNLQNAEGLWRIWSDPLSSPQYYPMVHTTFWVEYQLWGLNPLGYHVTNVLLHGLNSVLLCLLLLRLGVPGALFAALIFALHPVNVESVAWITERKNVLSGLFYLSSMLAYFYCSFTGAIFRKPDGEENSALDARSDSAGYKQKLYWISFVLFLFALLSKTVACSMPAVILLLVWWKRERISWKDIKPLTPFFLVGILLSFATVWIEKYHVGAKGAEWSLLFIDRVLIAGRALWFYITKLIFPIDLTFIYPRWEIDAGVLWQYIFPVMWILLVSILWILRERTGRGPLVAVLIFCGTLFPALGFFDVYPMRFSFVADHFKYLASIAFITMCAAGFHRIFHENRVLNYKLKLGIIGMILLVLSGLTWNAGKKYESLETLWQDTISKNPGAWIAHNNLAVIMKEKNLLPEAADHFQKAIRLKPDLAEAHYNLGLTLKQQGETEDALTSFRKALKLTPNDAEVYFDIGMALQTLQRFEEAARHYKATLKLNPHHADAYIQLGVLLIKRLQYEDAIDYFNKARKIKPENFIVYYYIGLAFEEKRNLKEALRYYRKAVELKPDHTDSLYAIGILYAKQGKLEYAEKEFRNIIALHPESAETHMNLGNVLASQGKYEDAVGHYSQAIRINPGYAKAHNNLGITMRIQGMMEKAVLQFKQALAIDPDYHSAKNNLEQTLLLMKKKEK